MTGNSTTSRERPTGRKRRTLLGIYFVLAVVAILGVTFLLSRHGTAAEKVGKMPLGEPGGKSLVFESGRTIAERDGRIYTALSTASGELTLTVRTGGTEQVLYQHSPESPDRMIISCVFGDKELLFLTEARPKPYISAPRPKSPSVTGTFQGYFLVDLTPSVQSGSRRTIHQSSDTLGRPEGGWKRILYRVTLEEGHETRVVPLWGGSGEPLRGVILTPRGLYWQRDAVDFTYQVNTKDAWWFEAPPRSTLYISPLDGSPPHLVADRLPISTSLSYIDGVLFWRVSRRYPDKQLDLVLLPDGEAPSYKPLLVPGAGLLNPPVLYQGRIYWTDWVEGSAVNSAAPLHISGGLPNAGVEPVEVGSLFSMAIDGTDRRVVLTTRDSENHRRICQRLSCIQGRLYLYYATERPASRTAPGPDGISRTYVDFVACLHPELPDPLSNPFRLPEGCVLGPLDEKYLYYSCTESLGIAPAVVDLFTPKAQSTTRPVTYRVPLPQ